MLPHDDTDRLPTRRQALGAALTLLAAAPVAALPLAGRPAAEATSATSATSFYANFKDARLLDQAGRRLDPATLAGRTVLVNFVFTGCSTVCPVQTRALAEVQRLLSPEVRARTRLLSVSLDPLNDTPQALNRFARRMGADLNGWSFATGRPQDVERIAEVLKLFRPGPDVRKPDDHSTALWLVDARGDLRMRYSGNPPEVNRLVREITVLHQMERSAASSARS